MPFPVTLLLLLLRRNLECGDGGFGCFIPSKRSGWWTSVDCVNKENSEKVAVNFFIFVPFFFNNLKAHYKICNTQEQHSVEKEIVESQGVDNLDRINTAVMEGKARSLGRRKLEKRFNIKIGFKIRSCKVRHTFWEDTSTKIILKQITSFHEHVLWYSL